MIQQSVKALVEGLNGKQREVDISTFTMVVLLVAILVKLVLWYVCAKIASHSPSADALAQVRVPRCYLLPDARLRSRHQISVTNDFGLHCLQDHRNDVFSNTIAIVAAFATHCHSSFWYLDSIGAVVISVYIAVSWLATGKEQVERLVGLRT